MSCILGVYKKLNINVERTEGKFLWDSNGKRYTDFFSGLSVTNLGHRHPDVIKAVNETIAKYIHLSNLFPEQNQEQLAVELIQRTIPGKVFFSNSGAEANECAIKTARKYFSGEKYEIISFVNSFHGRTFATLAATGQNKFKEGFGPVMEGFHHAEYNFLASVEDKINYKTCAVMVEVVQGEGGVNVAKYEFMQGLRKICNDNNILLIVDEIQTGLGRTGKFLGCQHYDIQPDIITLGKALGGGLPLAATIIKDEVAECMKQGNHGSTFGGNPVSCAAGLATVKSIDENFLSTVRRKGEILLNALKNLHKKFPDSIVDVRGLGLIIGMEISFKGEKLVDYLLKKGFIVNCIQDKIIRLLPPLIIEKHDIDEIVFALEEFFEEE